MKKLFGLSILIISFQQFVSAQMIIGRDSLFGNEWIDYTKTYYRIPIGSDGVYRLSSATLQTAGIPLSTVAGNQFQLIRLGQEIPIFTSTNGTFGASDFIEFYGQQNRGEIDQFMYPRGKSDMLNPEVSLINDTLFYYLTWANTPSTKRITALINNITNAPPKEVFFWHQEKLIGKNEATAFDIGSGVQLPEMNMGEGFAHTRFADGKDVTVTLKPSFIVAGQNAQMRLRWVGDVGTHHTAISLNGTQLLIDTSQHNYQLGYTIRDKTIDLTAAQVSATMAIRMVGQFEAADYNALALASVRYARQFRVESGVRYFEFDMPASNVAKYIEFENFNYDGAAPFLLDVTNGQRMLTDLNTATGTCRFLLPPSTAERKLVLYSRSAFTPTSLSRVDFVDLKRDGGDYILLSSQSFFNDNSGRNVVQEYANYRKTTEGGGYKPIVVDIEQVYEQFGYGIRRHPLSVRNFTFYAKKNWATPPRYLLILGKAREYPISRYAPNYFGEIAVPTWGFPGCDIMFVINERNHNPIFSVGRIAAIKPDEVRTYLDKVKEFESELKTAPQTIANRDWTKQIMHLSSGGQEGPTIKELMLNYGKIAENSRMGANITSFYKTNLDPVQTALNDRIFALYNSGVALSTFYGHSASTALDFDINNPDFLNNKAKYPLFLALGCSAANCHQPSTSVGESMIFYKNKGISVFTGTTGTSYLNALNQYATEFYRKFTTTNYGQTIGEITKATFAAFDSNTYTQTAMRSVLQEYQITGDPAMRFTTATGADYIPDATTVKIEPAIISAQVDSFAVSFEIVNIGLTDNDSINILIRQQLPTGKTVDILKRRIPTPQYRDKFSWFVPMPKEGTAGQNRLHITVDADNEVAELPAAAEANNDLLISTGEKGIPFLVLDNNVKPVYPAEFAIVGKKPITLKASTADPLAKEQNYIIEVDTTALFNSPLRQRQIIKQKGGVIKWQPTLDWKNNVVYYWRTSVDSIGRGGFAWESSSFLYLEGASEGWNQSHIEQLSNNTYRNLLLNLNNRRYDFVRTYNSVDLRYEASTPLTWRPAYFTNSNQRGINKGFPEQNGIYVCVFDSAQSPDLTLGLGEWWRPWRFPNYGLNEPNGNNVMNSYIFNLGDSSSFTGRKGFMDFIEKEIPDNNYVIVFTVHQSLASFYNPNDWGNDSIILGKNIFQVLEKQGASLIRNTMLYEGKRPYSFAFKKGRGALSESIGKDINAGAPISFNMANRYFQGDVYSPLIGPAKEWTTLEYEFYKGNIQDSISFDVIGVKADKTTEVVLKPNIINITGTIGINDINAIEYPFLKLRFFCSDKSARTPAQHNKWRILYKGLPDLAVSPNLTYQFNRDTLQQGEMMKIDVAIENLTDVDADSVLVKWTLRDEANTEVSSQSKFAPLSKNGNFVSSYARTTKDLKGKQKLILEVNPNMAQPETVVFNNYLQTKFQIETDKRNPLLDVTFDGIKIMNNDIVSPKPFIVVELRDDNKYLALADTGLFKLYIQPPSPATRRPIHFNDPSVRFNPATITANGLNKATIEYRPVFTQDGTYQLIVSGRDASGNISGDMDYSVAFQIITKSAISNVLNYPNPFSTKTQFVYTLTGETPPPYFKIQIMSVSGKVVREITQDEIGVLRIGTHRTEYSWDGTDEYGNKLANGVYLYRIIAKGADGKAFESYDTGTSDYFKKGIGKLVIIR